MIAAVLCVLLFFSSGGRLAASEKSFSFGQQAATGGERVDTAWSYDGHSGYTQHYKYNEPEILPKPLLPAPETALPFSGQSGYIGDQPKEPETFPKPPLLTPQTSWSFGDQSGYSGGTPASATGEKISPQFPAKKAPPPAAAAAAAPTKKQASGHAGSSGNSQAASASTAASSSSSFQPKYGMDPAGEPEYGLNQKAIDDIIREHNVFRAKEHVPPLSWNATLAKYSQDYAETKLKGDCKMVHSKSPYGENLMTGTSGYVTWKMTVDEWSDEKKSYHYGSNTCDPGKMCGHYTAVVWKHTTTVGCGRVKCNNGDIMIMCSYCPPGNYEGEKPF